MNIMKDIFAKGDIDFQVSFLHCFSNVKSDALQAEIKYLLNKGKILYVKKIKCLCNSEVLTLIVS